MVPKWYPKSQNRKIWCLSFLTHYRTSAYDFESQILKKLNFCKFQNFHLWVKIFKNRNRPIPAGKSYPGFIFEFFGPKTLLYIIRGRCGHVLVTLHDFILKKSIFWKTHKWLFSFTCLQHGTQKFRNLYDRKASCLSFLTHFRTSFYDL